MASTLPTAEEINNALLGAGTKPQSSGAYTSGGGVGATQATGTVLAGVGNGVLPTPTSAPATTPTVTPPVNPITDGAGGGNTGGSWQTKPQSEWTNADWSAWRKAQGAATAAASSGTGKYQAANLPSATSQNAYIQSLYDANLAKQQEALRAAYEANMLTVDQQAERIPQQYDAAANQASAQAELNRKAFNEYAAGNGLASGVGGQAQLAQNNALLNNITAIRTQQANALKDVENQRAQLDMEYKSAIAQAIADNNLNLAKALYEEAVRVDSSLVSTAVNQANENYKAYVVNKK